MRSRKTHSALADLLTRAASSVPRPSNPARPMSPLDVLMHTGLRRGEGLNLKRKDVPRGG